LEIGQPVDIDRFVAFQHRGLGARRLTKELQEFYTRRLVNGCA
jgi:hypothetical protein